MSEKVQGFWFSEANRLPHGDGRLVEVGTTHEVEGPLRITRYGLHFSESPLDALKYAPGTILWRIEAWGDLQLQKDKGVGRYRKYLWRLDVADLLREFARWCALQVTHLWEAPSVVLEFLTTGDESLRQKAFDAAFDAAHKSLLRNDTVRHASASAAYISHHNASSFRYLYHSIARARYLVETGALDSEFYEKQKLRLLAIIEEARTLTQ